MLVVRNIQAGPKQPYHQPPEKQVFTFIRSPARVFSFLNARVSPFVRDEGSLVRDAEKKDEEEAATLPGLGKEIRNTGRNTSRSPIASRKNRAKETETRLNGDERERERERRRISRDPCRGRGGSFSPEESAPNRSSYLMYIPLNDLCSFIQKYRAAGCWCVAQSLTMKRNRSREKHGVSMGYRCRTSAGSTRDHPSERRA